MEYVLAFQDGMGRGRKLEALGLRGLGRDR